MWTRPEAKETQRNSFMERLPIAADHQKEEIL